MAASLLLTLPPVNWTETGGIKWCSGGGDWHDYKPADPFGAGVFKGCPAVPSSWPQGQGIAACKKLCMQSDACLGFTWYPREHLSGGGDQGVNVTQCCFRTYSVAAKPACGGDPTCAATRCLQKWPDPPPPPPPPTGNITVAVGRRPYVAEVEGHVLIKTEADPSKRGQACTVTASLVGAGHVVSNGSWTLGLGDDAVRSYGFALAPLPLRLEDSLNVSIDCPALGWRTHRFRAFHRARAEGAPARSLTQVDHATRSMRVDGEPFFPVGWYYSLFDNARGEQNLTDFVAQQARAGVNTLLLYTLPRLLLHGRAALQAEVLAACEAVGMKVLMDIENFVPLIGLDNKTKDWADFVAVVRAVKDHPATLGYYLCDDCWGHDPAAQARVYRALKRLDPYHVTFGAGGTSSKFSDGEAAGGELVLSLDVPLIENYNQDLPGRSGPSSVENTGRAYPMFWTPFVNCPYSESANQLGLSETDYRGGYSPHRMRSTAYAGLVGDAPLLGLLFFDCARAAAPPGHCAESHPNVARAPRVSRATC